MSKQDLYFAVIFILTIMNLVLAWYRTKWHREEYKHKRRKWDKKRKGARV